MGNSVRDLAHNLSAAGHEVIVFTPDYGAAIPEENNIFIIRRLRPLFKIGNAAVLPQLMRRLDGFDAIHLHLPFLGATLPVLFFLIFHRRIRFIVTYHMDLAGDGLIKKILFFLYKKIALPLVLRRAARIVISSFDYAEHSDIANYFKKYRSKFVEIPFGVDEHKFYPKPKSTILAEKFFIDAGTKVLLFIGGLDSAHYFKGLEVLLRALRRAAESGLENVKLIIAGEGGLKQDYQNQAEALHLRDKIIFAGGISDNELVDYYNLADVLVLPSINRGEAFGIVLFEAASCGKPAIASDLPGVRTVIKDGETGFLSNPGDAGDLAEKIKKILLNDDLRIKMGVAARNNVENNYNCKKIFQEFIHLYNFN